LEAVLINDVVLEGIVVKPWEDADDLLFRLGCYRDVVFTGPLYWKR
jgi:hypothetical protein